MSSRRTEYDALKKHPFSVVKILVIPCWHVQIDWTYLTKTYPWRIQEFYPEVFSQTNVTRLIVQGKQVQCFF